MEESGLAWRMGSQLVQCIPYSPWPRIEVFPGVFIDKAQDIVPKEPLTDDNLRLRFRAAVNDGLGKGLTSIHDAGTSASIRFLCSQSRCLTNPH
jgi:hypothetical protein